jgi:hypothetical protein
VPKEESEGVFVLHQASAVYTVNSRIVSPVIYSKGPIMKYPIIEEGLWDGKGDPQPGVWVLRPIEPPPYLLFVDPTLPASTTSARNSSQ